MGKRREGQVVAKIMTLRLKSVYNRCICLFAVMVFRNTQNEGYIAATNDQIHFG